MRPSVHLGHCKLDMIHAYTGCPPGPILPLKSLLEKLSGVFVPHDLSSHELSEVLTLAAVESSHSLVAIHGQSWGECWLSSSTAGITTLYQTLLQLNSRFRAPFQATLSSNACCLGRSVLKQACTARLAQGCKYCPHCGPSCLRKKISKKPCDAE